jgi:hypothetical protein
MDVGLVHGGGFAFDGERALQPAAAICTGYTVAW